MSLSLLPPRFSAVVIATALSLSPLPAAASEGGWAAYLDLLSPDRLIQRGLQMGIMSLRTQMDIKYGDMSVNALSGQVTLSDLRIWPRPDWDASADCQITVDRLAVRSAAPDQLNHIGLKFQATGVYAPPVCLPPDVRPMLAVTGLDRVYIPRLTIDFDYDIAGAGARVHLYGDVADLAAVDLTADMPYLWVNGRNSMNNPDPVVFLSSATLSVENMGGWGALSAMLPPPVTNPETAALSVQGFLGSIIGGINRSAAGPPAEGSTEDPSRLSPAQQDFIASAVAGWTSFLKNPSRLVLETSFDPAADVFVDFKAYEDDPRQIFADLQPQITLTPASARAVLPAALLTQAMAGGDGLTPKQRLTAGTALITGIGAPRNIAAGTSLLSTLAREGIPGAADTLSEALEQSAPADAYHWALLAGAAGITGATARLDRLERRLPFAKVLELQAAAAADKPHPLGALQKVSLIRVQATGRMSGNGQTRSYGIASMWAALAAAAGDAEGADILAEIDEMIRRGGPEAAMAWAPVADGASKLATKAWIGQNLPARFSTTE